MAEVGGNLWYVAVTEDSVWVTDRDDDSVVRLDPESLEVTDTIGVGREPIGVGASDEAAWVASVEDGTVGRIGLG